MTAEDGIAVQCMTSKMVDFVHNDEELVFCDKLLQSGIPVWGKSQN